MAKDKISVADQTFDWNNTTNVSKAMIRAGTVGRSRIKAGVVAAWNAKTASMYGKDTTTGARVMRAVGMQNAAKWYDRLLAKESKYTDDDDDSQTAGAVKETEDKLTDVITTGFEHVRGEFQQIKGALTVNASRVTQLGGMVFALNDAISSVHQDVRDIKTLIMPRKLDRLKGRPVKGEWGQWDRKDAGQIELAHYDPLAPEGKKFVKSKLDYYGKGKTGPYKQGEAGTKPISKGFLQSAVMQAAKQTAKLVSEINARDAARAEQEKKRQDKLDSFKFKDVEEEAKKEDPLEEFKKDVDDRLTRIEENTKKKGGLLDWISTLLGGMWGKITDFFSGPLSIIKGLAGLIPMAGLLLGKAGLVGVAGVLGYAVGTWLNNEFKLDEKINNAIDTALGWFGLGHKAAADAALATNTFKDSAAPTNQRLKGTGYELVSAGKYKGPDGNVVGVDELPEEARKRVDGRILTKEEAIAMERRWAESKGYTNNQLAMGGSGRESTGTLSASTYESRLNQLGDIIASGESHGDYNVFNKGTVGKNKGKIGREDLSNMTISEFLRRGNLGKDDPNKMFATGKYQITPDTMREAIKALGINPENTYLTPATQERIFRDYLIGKKPRVVDYLSGRSDDVNGALLDLSKEWASIGVPHDVMRDGELIKKGQSYYAGKGGNRAFTSPEEITSALTPIPSTSADDIDRESRNLMSSTATVPPTVVVSAPVQNNRTINSTNAPRSLPKASALTDDQSFIRGSIASHPVSG